MQQRSATLCQQFAFFHFISFRSLVHLFVSHRQANVCVWHIEVLPWHVYLYIYNIHYIHIHIQHIPIIIVICHEKRHTGECAFEHFPSFCSLLERKRNQTVFNYFFFLCVASHPSIYSTVYSYGKVLIFVFEREIPSAKLD